MKEKHPLNLSSERRVELLSHYFKIDQASRLVYVQLRFDKASDLLEESFGIEGNAMFKSSILEMIGEIYGYIPVEYRAEIELEIGDYEGYDPKSILARFNEALELNNYRSQRDKKKKWLRATLLVLAGLAILTVMGFGSVNHWFGAEGSETASLWTEVLDIAGWVFIWEAVTISFLQPNELGRLGVKILSRTNGIRLYHRGDPTLLCQENGASIVSKWVEEGKLAIAGKSALLLSSAGFLAVGSGVLLSTCLSLFSSMPEMGEFWVQLILAIMTFVFDSVGGIAGLSRYLGRGPLQKFSFPFAVIATLQIALSIAFSIVYNTWSFTFSTIFMALFQVGYVFGVIIDLLKRKGDGHETKEESANNS